MQELGLYQSFDQKITIPPVRDLDELERIMKHSKVFQDKRRRDDALKDFESRTGNRSVGIGIKSILLAIDTAKQDEDLEGRFVQTIVDIRNESELY